MMEIFSKIESNLNDQPKHVLQEQWNPPLCGDIDINIKSNGDWFHEGAKIERHAIVKLFYSILRRETDGYYYLVTPVEKWRITVEQAACLVVDMDVQCQQEPAQEIVCITNMEKKVCLGQQYQFSMSDRVGSVESLPMVSLNRGLSAKLTRSVYYRLVDLAVQKDKQWQVYSGSCWFVLGDV